MRGMNSECIDLIYLDPPFNSNTNYAAPIGSQAAGAEFKDTWTLEDVDIAWLDLIKVKHPKLQKIIDAALSPSDKSYLIYMSIRLLEMHRILKPEGSIYLHCDPKMAPWLKLLLDCILGKRKFRNEIIWHFQAGTKGKYHFGRKHHNIYFYSGKGCFNRQSKPVVDPSRYNKVDKDGRRYDVNGAGYRYYLDEGATCDDVWTWVQEKEFQQLNSQSKERTGFPTQKPLALLSRIIKASSKEGDLVFDPFCGCATTLEMADALNRRWVGIDVSPKAADLIRWRLGEGRVAGGGYDDHLRPVISRTDIPERTDLGDLTPYNSPKIKDTLYGEQGGNCNGCKEHFNKQNLTIDHIIARKSGGTDHLNNLQLLCGHCNSVKGDRGMEYLIAKLAA